MTAPIFSVVLNESSSSNSISIDIESSSKSLGRPKGSKNKAPGFRNYKVYKWTPKHQMCVALYIIGESNISIGEKVGFTPFHVSQILGTEQALEIINNAKTHINTNTADRIVNIQNMAMNHIESFVRDDGETPLAKKAPFAFIEKVIQISKGVGSLKSDSMGKTETNITNNVLITGEAANRITKALELSREISATPTTLMDNGTRKLISTSDSK